MNGVPYIPINTEALRELREEKSMRYNPDADSDSGTIIIKQNLKGLLVEVMKLQ